MCIGQWCFVRHYLPLVSGASPSIFLEHESHESIECRYKKRPWRLESHECILYDTPTVFLSVVIREIINTDGVSSQSSFVRLPPVGRWVYDKSREIRVLSKSASACVARCGFAWLCVSQLARKGNALHSPGPLGSAACPSKNALGKIK